MKNKFQYTCICILSYIIICPFWTGCSKMVEIGNPINSISTNQVFADSINATSAILGIYTALSNTNGSLFFATGAITVAGGQSADELNGFVSNGSNTIYDNNVLSDDEFLYGLWKDVYAHLYRVNACIEGIMESKGIPEILKRKFLSELRFVRAWCYFYLINYYGDVPLVTTSDWKKESQAGREDLQKIYQFIIEDLKYSIENGSDDFSFSGGEKVRANKWTACALMARVCLFVSDWENADLYASMVINQNQLFALNTQLRDVFLKNSMETILALNTNTRKVPFDGTTEGMYFNPFPDYQPFYWCNEVLIKSFEPSDKRRNNWIDSTEYNGTKYWFPTKYKVTAMDAIPGGQAKEYPVVLRLSEQYLIRSEARMELGDMDGAIEDINTIRKRAELPEITFSNEEEGRSFIIAERRHELFAEWGHRWIDLKRYGIADEVLRPIKPLWKSTAVLYPIPLQEIQRNSQLIQNAGY